MKPRARIAVIGGGIIGTSIAWQLAENGAEVVLFERTVVGAEASWAAAGMLSPGGELDEAGSEADFYLERRRLYPEFISKLTAVSREEIDYRDCGALDLAYTPEEWQHLQDRAARQQRLGISSRTLTAQKVQALSALIETKGLEGAVFYPGDGLAAPRELLPALRIAAETAGVQIREHVSVRSIEVTKHQVKLAGEAFASTVIAAGAWSSHIVLSGAPPIPVVEPVKGHLLAFELQLGACPTIVRHGSLYMFQRSSGRVVVGATVENAGFDRSIDPACAHQLHQQATAILPVLEKLNPVEVWTGLRPQAKDLQLGWWQDTPVYLAYGHYRNGILLAPATARAAARDYQNTGYLTSDAGYRSTSSTF